MTRRALAIIVLALHPDVAMACATCLDSAYGNRSFNGAFVGMLLAPLLVAGGLLGAIAWICRRQARGTVGRRRRGNPDT